MKQFLGVVTLCLFSGMAMAGTGLNCAEEGVLDDAERAQACEIQVNDELNAEYKRLQDMHKDSAEKLEALKKMQLGWIQMRDNQCQFQAYNSAGGGGAALTEMRCVIGMTMQRTAELEAL